MRRLEKFLILAGMVAAFIAGAATITEDFATDPRAGGWRGFGDTNLFRWNAAHQNVEITWNSSRSNSFLHLPLGTILSTADQFSVAFDLRLHDIAIGASSNKPYTFQIALGLVNFAGVTGTNVFRGAGQSAYGVRNTVEFDYFPDSGYGATFAPTVISSNNRVAFSDNHPLPLTTGDVFRITMSHSNLVLRTTVARNGLPYGLPPGNTIKNLSLATYPDFRVDSFALINWHDAVQIGPTQFWGSVLAHGTVDNVVVTTPEPPVQNLAGAKSNSVWRATFLSRPNWSYALERTVDFATWRVSSPTNAGDGAAISLLDINCPNAAAAYRVRAMKP
jgi:hypothetical protein